MVNEVLAANGFTVEDVVKLSSDARQKLSSFASATASKQIFARFNKLGGAVGVADLAAPYHTPSDPERRASDLCSTLVGVTSLVTLAKADMSGDGKLDDGDVENLLDAFRTAVQRQESMLVNGGVVSALVLSMAYPYAHDTELDVGLSWGIGSNTDALNSTDAAFTGIDAQRGLEVASYVCMSLATLISLAMVMVNALLYNVLAFGLCDLSSKVWLINEVRLVTVVIIRMDTLIAFLALSLVFKQAAISKSIGIIVHAAIALSLIAMQFYIATYITGYKVSQRTQAYVKTLLASRAPAAGGGRSRPAIAP